MDSKEPDAQAAHEFTLTAVLPALAGANMIYGVGMLDSGMTWDYAQAVMQNEMVRMIVKAVEGLPINDDLMALDVIESVGPGGEYLTNMHTFQNFRKEFYTPIIEQKEAYAGWKEKGSESIELAANRKWKAILENYQEPAMPDENLRELESYIEKKYGR